MNKDEKKILDIMVHNLEGAAARAPKAAAYIQGKSQGPLNRNLLNIADMLSRLAAGETDALLKELGGEVEDEPESTAVPAPVAD